MPIIKSAIKKLRRDNKKRLENKAVLLTVKKVIKDVRVLPSAEGASKAFSAIDKAVKKGLIKKNTAARKKSQISKFLTNVAPPTAKAAKTTKTTKVVAKKASKKSA